MEVQNCFHGKNIFITGGSGFIGKALIEKILRTIPNIGDIYVLLRAKKGKTSEERLEGILNDKLFDTIKETNPSALGKLKCIAGDVVELKLGINDSDRKVLTDNVDIIYNCAASIRFDDPLRYAILVNVRSTRELIELAKETKHLKAFIHMSTAYCNVDKTYVEEKLYPSHGNWRDAIRLAEEADDHLLNVLTQKYIHPLPNTYTYAKSLSEHTVQDLCYGQIPAVIVRPSIVTNMRADPMPGWTDNLNGPIGLFYFGGSGLLRAVYSRREGLLDYVPVDVTVRVIVISTCEALKNQNLNQIEIYNNSQSDNNDLSIQDQLNIALESAWVEPPAQLFWYPVGYLTTCKYDYYLRVLLFHILPSLLIDFMLRIAGQKPRVFKIQKKVYVANKVLFPFTKNFWYFDNKNAMALESKLTPQDLPEYGFKNFIKWNRKQYRDYVLNCQKAVEILLFNIRSDLQTAKKRFKLLWALNKSCSVLSYVVLIWFLNRINVHGILYNYLKNYVNNL